MSIVHFQQILASFEFSNLILSQSNGMWIARIPNVPPEYRTNTLEKGDFQVGWVRLELWILALMVTICL